MKQVPGSDGDLVAAVEQHQRSVRDVVDRVVAFGRLGGHRLRRRGVAERDGVLAAAGALRTRTMLITSWPEPRKTADRVGSYFDFACPCRKSKNHCDVGKAACGGDPLML